MLDCVYILYTYVCVNLSSCCMVQSLEGLLNRDDELVQEVKRLDSDMQVRTSE